MTDNSSMNQDWDQDQIYLSESTGKQIEIRTMPCPVAARAYAKIERKCGYGKLETPLAKALRARADMGIGAEAIEFDGPTGAHRMMLRDKETKKFRAGTTRI